MLSHKLHAKYLSLCTAIKPGMYVKKITILMYLAFSAFHKIHTYIHPHTSEGLEVKYIEGHKFASTLNGGRLNCSLSLRRHTHGPLAKHLMHMAHLSGNTSGVSKSSSDWLNSTGFPGDVCVAFFNVPPGNKDAVMPNPIMKEESRRVYKCDDERLSGSTKRWIQPSVWRSGYARLAKL